MKLDFEEKEDKEEIKITELLSKLKEKDVISSDAASATNFSRFAAILENAKWKYILSPRRGSYSTHSIQSSMHAAYNDSSNMMAINPTVSLMTSLPAEQLIPDLRFVSAKKSEQSTGARTVIFLPKEILADTNIQTMKGFLNNGFSQDFLIFRTFSDINSVSWETFDQTADPTKFPDNFNVYINGMINSKI